MTDRDPLPPSASSTSASTSTSLRSRLGLPLLAIVALALLAAPRVILHDLGIIQEGTAINALFVFLPPLLWLVLVLAARVPNVFLTIFAIGLCYAVFLAVGHQITWSVVVADDPPRLGGNLAALDPTIQAVIFRGFAVVSSLVTGAVVGAITGAVGWCLNFLFTRARKSH